MNPTTLFRKFLALPKLYSIGGTIVVVAVVAVGANVLTRSAPSAQNAAAGTSHVSVASVASLSSAAGPLPVTGKVTSLSEATILAQTSGEIVSLDHAIGDHVAAGTVIASFENSSQEAAVLQAQGAYDAAVSALNRTTGTSNENTTASSITALQSAYAAADDAVHTRADQLFTSPRSNPQIILIVPDSALVAKLQSERSALEATLADAQAQAQTTATTSVTASSAQMTSDLQSVLAFLDDLIKAVNETPVSSSASATTLSGYQTLLSTARTEVVSAISGLTSAKSAYDANDVSAAQANVKEAQGALDAAEANLEKTLVRSPISGTIVSLPITEGDFVSSFAQVAVVSNPGALYADVEVTPSDAKTLAVGNKASVNGSVAGVITFIAPALDPTTSKIEVKVGLTGDQSSLTDGEIVPVTLNRSESTAMKTDTSTDITIPIVAAKITPTGPIVFTVTASSTLEAHAITLGSILGDQVVVASGLTPDMDIVTDARGLAEGQTVIVDAQ